ncbi:MAG: GtrA family protein [Actinobacteria bacterium]|nr:MAG: GtrA family protein [Actinomycetota bacterium]
MPFHLLPERLRSPVAVQFIKYGLVGALNTGLTIGLYALLLAAGVWYVLAYVLAYAVGIVNGYLMNRAWTFVAERTHFATAVRYFAVQGGGLALSTGVVYLAVDVGGLSKILGQIVAIAAAVITTFFANRWWTFAARHHRRSAEAPSVS